MSDQPQSAAPSQDNNRTAEPSTKSQPPKSSRQRFKPQLSCTLCRTRKLRCDRSLPCQNCVKRDLSASCTYVHAGIRRDKATPIHKSNANSGSRDVQSQISRLEELVISLMNKTNPNGLVPSGDQRDPSEDDTRPLQEGPRLDDQWTEVNGLKETEESFGRINIDDEQPNYVGSTHWAAILDNIACLKDKINNPEPPVEEETSQETPTTGPDLLVGGYRKATRNEILASVPSRSIVDHMMKEYFKNADMGSTMFHQPTFRKEYENFWKEPTKMPIMWIGMLFSILCLTAYFEVMSETNSFSDSQELALRDPIEKIALFRERTVQCLVLGNYTVPGPYTVETLMVYYIAEHFRSRDTRFGLWLVYGLVIRAAMRLGFHRDASHYPNISVFQGEMQRRLWASIVHLDLQTSLQVGLPRMIKDGMYDTEPPRNLLDEDFDEHSKVLPPPRPETELLAIGYSNIKHRITRVFGTIVDQANSTYPISYDEVLKLDKVLHQTHQSMPDILKLRSIEDLASGSVEMRVRRFSIDITFQKARCVLHRKFFVLSKATATYPYPYSMKACIEAAMRILECQIYIHNETQPGTVMHKQRWKASSLVTHDFLVAAMLICLYLGHCVGQAATQQTPECGIRVKWSPEDMLQTIKSSHRIFEEMSSSSTEALKAAKALSGMLAKVRGAGFSPSTNDEATIETARSISNHSYGTSSASLSSARQAFQNPQLHQSSTQWPGTSTSLDQNRPVDMSAYHQTADINEGIPGTVELDWELWDNHFYSNGLSQTPPDLWSFDANASLSYPDQESFMQWDQQL